MKVKNLMFSGFMAAILTGIACSADAAVVASKEYVDARETSILDTVAQEYQKSETALTQTDVQNEITAVVGTADEGLIKDVADNTAAIEDLSDDVSQNTAAIATLNGDANTTGSVQNQIKVLSDLLGGTSGDVSTLTTQVTANTTAIETLNGDGTGSVANKISSALENYSTSAQVDGKISTALSNYDTSGEVDTKIQEASDTLTTEINKKQNTIIGDQLAALNSGITAEKVTNYDNYATTKQDIMSAGNDYVTIADNKVSVKVDGSVAANNTGLITGGTVYTYALPKPTNCTETTCVLSVNGDGQPYWMKLELASSGSSEPETTNE